MLFRLLYLIDCSSGGRGHFSLLQVSSSAGKILGKSFLLRFLVVFTFTKLHLQFLFPSKFILLNYLQGNEMSSTQDTYWVIPDSHPHLLILDICRSHSGLERGGRKHVWSHHLFLAIYFADRRHHWGVPAGYPGLVLQPRLSQIFPSHNVLLDVSRRLG